MDHIREQMRATLFKEAEAVIDKLLDWNEAVGKPTLTQIEEEVLVLRKEMGQGMAEVVLQNQEATRPVGACCPTCQGEMQNKGMKKVVVESRVGMLEMERSYYYCPHCREGFFPPG